MLVNNSGRPSYYAHYVPDLSLAYMSSAIRSKGYGTELVDLNHLGKSDKDVMESIRSKKPLFVGFKLIGNGLMELIDLAKDIKRHYPNTVLVGGGPQVTTHREKLLELGNVFDFLVFGEGETAIQELIDFLEGKLEIARVRNLIYRSKGSIVANPGLLETNLDMLPFPDWDLFDLNAYFPLFMINMVRGCPHQCSFCSHNYFWGREEQDENLRGKDLETIKAHNTVRKRSWNSIRKELVRNIGRYGVTLFEIVDSTPDIQLLRKYCQYILKNSLNVNWVGFGRVGYYSDELYSLFSKSGCIALWYGFESGNQELLMKMGKFYSVDDIRHTVETAKRQGIKVIGAFMVGFPGETSQTLDDTLKLMRELDINTPVLIPFFLQRGSPIEYNPALYGVTVREDWLDLSLKPWSEREQHQIDYFSVNGMPSSEWWHQFEKQSGYKNWVDKRDLSETEILELLADLLDIERERLVRIINSAILNEDKKTLSELICEAWERSRKRAGLL